MRFLKSISGTAPLRRLAAVILFGTLPGLAAAQACPDINGPTITPLSYDASQLAQPQSMQMVAGGDINLSNCQDVPGGGFVVSGPDYELQLTGVAPGSNLRRKSAPTLSAPVPPSASKVTTLPSASNGESSPKSIFCTIWL